MPIFHEKDGDKGTFGPTMGAALAKHRMGERKDDERKDEKDGGEKDKKATISEHLTQAEEHLKKAKAAHEGEEHAEEHDGEMGEMGEDEGGSALESMMGGSEE